MKPAAARVVTLAWFYASIILSAANLRIVPNRHNKRSILESSSASLDGTVGSPRTGVGLNRGGESGIEGDSTSSSVETQLVKALEADDQVTVIGSVQLGELLCDSLTEAEDAPTLNFSISPDQTFTAEKSSYTVINGAAFADGITRKVWIGQEVGNTVGAHRRTVSMTWGEPCDVETFLFKVATVNEDGSITTLKTVPCNAGTSSEICIVEVQLNPRNEEDPVEYPRGFTTRGNGRRLSQASLHNPGEPGSIPERITTGTSKRQLQSNVQIDLMILYTEGAKESLGGISDAQMETALAAAITSTNEAMTNSDIDLEISVVYVGPLAYNDDDDSAIAMLDAVQGNVSVQELRDTYGADLVQVVGSLGTSCGIAYTFYGLAEFAFSVTNPLCFDSFSHTHEIAHNLGCDHNEEDAVIVSDYAYGWRYCNGTDMYRTIMAYPCSGAPRVNYLSNPDVSLYDKPTGKTTADCARAIKENVVTVAGYRNRESSAATPAPTPSANDGSAYAGIVNSCLDRDGSGYRCGGKNGGTIIDLKRCGLTDDDAGSLRACFETASSDVSRIEKIKLNVNDFTTLPVDLLDGMTSLAVLNLQSNCRLSCIPSSPSRALDRMVMSLEAILKLLASVINSD